MKRKTTGKEVSKHYVNHSEKASHLLSPFLVQLLVYLKEIKNTESTSFLNTVDMTFMPTHSLLLREFDFLLPPCKTVLLAHDRTFHNEPGHWVDWMEVTSDPS